MNHRLVLELLVDQQLFQLLVQPYSPQSHSLDVVLSLPFVLLQHLWVPVGGFGLVSHIEHVYFILGFVFVFEYFSIFRIGIDGVVLGFWGREMQIWLRLKLLRSEIYRVIRLALVKYVQVVSWDFCKFYLLGRWATLLGCEFCHPIYFIKPPNLLQSSGIVSALARLGFLRSYCKHRLPSAINTIFHRAFWRILPRIWILRLALIFISWF